MLIRELIAIYLEQLRDEGACFDSIHSQIKPLLRLLGDKEAASITGLTVERYRMERRKEKTIRGGPPSHSTINRELTYLRAALNRAVRLEALARVPAFRMVSEADCIRTDWCTQSSLDKILAYMRPRHPDIADAIEVYFLTGWRKREVLDLAWSEIRFEDQRIELPPTRAKSRTPRVFPLVGRLMEIFTRRRQAGGPLVFPSPRTGRARVTFRKAWLSATKAAGCLGLTLHGFRRSFATYSLMAGIAPVVTRQLAGWKSDLIHRRYQIIEHGQLADAVRTYADFIDRIRKKG